MTLEWTRVLLSQWGRWCRGKPRTGYPMASAFMFANMGSRAAKDDDAIPDEIAVIERVICALTPHDKQLLTAFYATNGPVWLKAGRIQLTRRTFMRRVGNAEQKVYRTLLSLDHAPKST